MSFSPSVDETRPRDLATRRFDVLVVGGGPSGAAAAYWLADAGHDVAVVEKKHFPRVKTCGDGLTPRSVHQLYEMGLSDELTRHHRFDGLRCLAFNKELTLNWPKHPLYPSHGYVVTRSDLDAFVAKRAEKAGATIIQGAEAIAPLRSNGGESGPLDGAVVTDHDRNETIEIRSRYVVVADGANSRFGRALGASRNRSLPLGMALRGYYESPRHAESYIESHLDIRDRDGSVIPGYGWIFPLGDGRVNVGIGLLSTAERWKKINTSKLMDAFVHHAPESWCLSDETSLGAPTGGKLPMGLSVGPRTGPNYLLVGDAAGTINPFNGEGIAYGYETGRIAAEVIDQAITANDPQHLSCFDDRIKADYGLYYKAGSAFMTLMERPALMRTMVNTGMYSRSIMEWLLRIMANLLRPDELGPAEMAYKAATSLLRRAN